MFRLPIPPCKSKHSIFHPIMRPMNYVMAVQKAVINQFSVLYGCLLSPKNIPAAGGIHHPLVFFKDIPIHQIVYNLDTLISSHNHLKIFHFLLYNIPFFHNFYIGKYYGLVRHFRSTGIHLNIPETKLTQQLVIMFIE